MKSPELVGLDWIGFVIDASGEKLAGGITCPEFDELVDWIGPVWRLMRLGKIGGWYLPGV